MARINRKLINKHKKTINFSNIIAEGLEEKQNELKEANKNLHESYMKLFKTNCDLTERSKIEFDKGYRTQTIKLIIITACFNH